MGTHKDRALAMGRSIRTLRKRRNLTQKELAQLSGLSESSLRSYVSDGIENYVVHLLINRSDLSNGKRMNEGRADAVAKIHANRIRVMDVRWGLRQVKKGVANSQIHAKQPPRYTTKEVCNEQDASE